VKRTENSRELGQEIPFTGDRPPKKSGDFGPIPRRWKDDVQKLDKAQISLISRGWQRPSHSRSAGSALLNTMYPFHLYLYPSTSLPEFCRSVNNNGMSPINARNIHPIQPELTI
jgi:hypothetical protein